MSKRFKEIPQARKPFAATTQAKFDKGLRLHQQGKLSDAEQLYEKVLQHNPAHFDALHHLGVIALQTGRTQQGVELIVKAITLNPNIAAAHSHLGVGLMDLQRPEEALASYDKALALKPDLIDAYNNRGIALFKLKRAEEALASYDKALALKPNYANAYYNRGMALKDLRRLEEAVASYDKALALEPGDAEAYNNRGIALKDLKRPEEALASYDRALALKPDFADAYDNRGIVLCELRRLEDLLASYDRAIALKPDFADAYDNRGLTLFELQRLEEAVASYDKAIALKPDHVRAYRNRGNALRDLRRLEEAVASYERAIALKPDFEFPFGAMLLTKMQMCDFADLEGQCARVCEQVLRGEKVAEPFAVLAISNSPEAQRRAAEIWIEERYPTSAALPALAKRAKHARIKIGYFSADFRNHAMANLTANLFEQHDRSNFEIIAFSFGPNQRDEMRLRMEAAFDRFIDVRDRDDKYSALLSRNMEIDIAVDLGGFTSFCRTGIFALRAAPVQVNYLGYPGTMGAGYIDYIIADPILIPDDSRRHYSEKIVYLPNTYMVNDSKRPISDAAFTRAELGLPAIGFVFCCFNNNYKITPGVFDRWMRILEKVEGSVLWLLEDNPQAAGNLRREASARGVGPERLIFAKRLPSLGDHLARHRLADLFLDTLPYNAHTTASDSLWAGLPVLTCLGETFASRVAASLLKAIDLPELVTTTPEAYELLAIELAANPNRLADIRRKLARNRLTTPLFDTKLFANHIEAAYAAMHERCHAGLPPDHFQVAN